MPELLTWLKEAAPADIQKEFLACPIGLDDGISFLYRLKSVPLGLASVEICRDVRRILWHAFRPLHEVDLDSFGGFGLGTLAHCETLVYLYTDVRKGYTMGHQGTPEDLRMRHLGFMGIDSSEELPIDEYTRRSFAFATKKGFDYS
ncbi:MAG: hypothetical protein QF486_05770 [Candidatus Woesearchaeota archaeon]|jgi:hypothetical protein|nr:hypothetical protein [Candidatus Woesearchaeota archaeon]MDP7182207.1 hypothetical protein [Candidatus Woesearchaeota archaeon]MDP7199094.1 hypothetical protein [Candidatus Woesearchaeota archaeon]MDP7467804.1 hypothetical protein [Candidatus Woesearchaeota archaeon]MDP7647944.1 hypothetical protein [Candidatus Woesearchaeota archaeon]|tara:strand:+ start:392 stop:829 length:438 start_codon:yes stop_codon:yes gene_type:complete